MIISPAIPELLIRPPEAPDTRILFLARHAPEEPAFLCRFFSRRWWLPGLLPSGLGRSRPAGLPGADRQRLPCLADGRGADRSGVFPFTTECSDNPEIFVASTCAFLGLPCVGAGPNVRALAEDKWFSKLAVKSMGLPVADGAFYGTEDDLVQPPPFPGPYFVKNRFGAASEGISAESVQDDWAGASRRRQITDGPRYGGVDRSLCSGIDLTVPVLGGRRRSCWGWCVRGRTRRAASSPRI